MATEILLTSETFVKSVTSASDNLNAKYLRPSIREAQEIHYKRIVGGCLLNKLKALVAASEIELPENIAYKLLLEESQYYLAYMALVEVSDKVAYKIANVGVVKTADQNIYNASQDEIAKLKYYYQAKADATCYELQGYILKHKADYPELDRCQCERIRSNLTSAATCGIWLGGARGKHTTSPCGCTSGRRIN